MVVAPHPDDEVLGVGGLLATLAAAGVPVDLLAVTDGDASHPGSPTLAPAELARLRRNESDARAACARGAGAGSIGSDCPTVRWRRTRDAVVGAVADLLGGAGPETWVLATWRGDRHPDHEAVGRAAQRGAGNARLLEFPVWAWHWSHPDDPRVPWLRLRAVALDDRVVAAKHAAVACFRTQIAPLSDDPADAPVLPGHVLERLLRPWEAVLV